MNSYIELCKMRLENAVQTTCHPFILTQGLLSNVGSVAAEKKNNQSNKQKTSKQQTNNKKNIASSLLPASAKQCWFFAGTQGPRVALTASSSTWYTL